MTDFALRRVQPIVVGGDARADFLPQDVRDRVRSRATRRALIGVVLLALVVITCSFAWASVAAAQSQSALADERARTADLLEKQSRFTVARRLDNEVETAEAARRIASSTEVLWAPYLTGIDRLKPEGATYTTFSIDTGSPIESIEQAVVPLQVPRIGTIGITGTTPSYAAAHQWVTALEDTPGFGDVTLNDATRVDGDTYDVTITLHVTNGMLADRFAEEDEK
jgi:Tfp pilus assembly protein PilN